MLIRSTAMALVLCLASPAWSGPEGAVVRGAQSFAVDIYKQLSGEKGNVLFSPMSIHIALDMLLAGAAGETKSQMAKVLGLKQPDAAHASAAALIELLNPRAKKVPFTLRMANGVWSQGTVLKPFKKTVSKFYRTRALAVNFGKHARRIRKTINRWVKVFTQGKITNLIPKGSFDALTRMVLVNAIYFKGLWAIKFDKKATRSGMFAIGDGKKVPVKMMHRRDKYRYAAIGNVKVAVLPYRGPLELVLVLPKRGTALSLIEAKLSSKKIDQWAKATRKRKIELALPRFKLEASMDAKQVLKELGMVAAFGKGSDFSGINGKRDLYVSKVLHKAFIEVNEEGTEAAAATAVIIRRRGLPPPVPTFVADRPFLFLLRHKSGAPLFMGRVADPR